MESVTSGYLIEIFHKLNKILENQEKILRWQNSRQETESRYTADLWECTRPEDSCIFGKSMQTEEPELQQEQKNSEEELEIGPFTTECHNGDPLSSQDLEVLPEWLEHSVDQLLEETQETKDSAITRSETGHLFTSPPGLSKLPLKRTYHVFSMYDVNNEYNF